MSRAIATLLVSTLLGSCATTRPRPEAGEPAIVPAPAQPQDKQTPLSVGTFNLLWAFDQKDGRSRLADRQNANTKADWVWKCNAIAELLKVHDLDILAVQEIGGQRELAQIATVTAEISGPGYYYALFTGQDKRTRQQVALYSKYPIEKDRRWQIDVAKHLVAEVNLPTGQRITVVVVHLSGGRQAKSRRRRSKEALALKQELNKLEGPVLVLGDFETDLLPEAEGYAHAAPGIIAGAHTPDASDDCTDSAGWAGGRKTLLTGEPSDRIFACRAKLTDVAVGGQEQIVTGQIDPPRGRRNWSSVPADSPPYRDLSDHLLLRGRIELSE